MLMGLESRKYNPNEGAVKPSRFENEENPAPLPGGKEISDIYDPTKTENEANPAPLTQERAGIKMPELATVESAENLDDEFIDALYDEDEIESALEDAPTLKDAEASKQLAEQRAAAIAEAAPASIGLTSGVAGSEMGGKRQVATTEVAASLGKTEEAKRSVDLAKKKFGKKLESSSEENVLMEIEMELENKGFALEDAQEDNQESVVRGLQMEIDALNETQDWIKNAA
jgi:hypothetical protein